MPRQEFPNLQAKSFLHPNDAQALKALQAIPLLSWGLKKAMGLGTEEATRLMHMASDIKVTPQTCPHIYEMMLECSRILDMPKLDVYITQTPTVNAFTEGVERPMITLHSGLIDLLDENELLAVIAHEMGHAKCEHLLYHNLAIWALKIGGFFGNWAQAAVTGLMAALYKWLRESELSADRAALLVVQDHKVVVNLLMKLAGGSQKIAAQLDYNEFLKQSRAYKTIADANTWKKMINLYNTVFINHPFPVMRAAELVDWAESDQYKNILSGNYIRTQEYVKCPNCPAMNPPDTILCPKCLNSTSVKPKKFWEGVLGKQ